jgi:predicted RND superfamily exporter protein
MMVRRDNEGRDISPIVREIVSWLGLALAIAVLWTFFALVKASFGLGSALGLSLSIGISLYGSAWYRDRGR